MASRNSTFTIAVFLLSIIFYTTSINPTSSSGSIVITKRNVDHNTGHQNLPSSKPRGPRGKNPLRTRDLGHMTSVMNTEGFCELEVHCKGESTTGSLPVRLPIKGARGHPGPPGEKGEKGADGGPGYPGLPGLSPKKKVAFFVGLTENFGPVDENSDIVFDRVVTNVGSAYNPSTGRFTAPITGVYQFNVIISAQGREKAAVMVLKNGEMMATVWAESIPYWATSSNIVVLNLHKGDQVWLLLLSRASHLHGYMYTTFSGFMVFDL